MVIFNGLKRLFSKGPYNLQTFTYFIPAPPARKSGYREKNFDNMINELSIIGFDIVDIRTQSIATTGQSGMWIILTLRPLTKEANQLKPSDFPEEFNGILQNSPERPNAQNLQSSSKSIELPTEDDGDEELKGIYYID